MADKITFKVIKDYSAFGEGDWQKHVALVQWGNNKPKLDIRPWNSDMTKPGKGFTLDSSDAYDLMTILEEVLAELADGEN